MAADDVTGDSPRIAADGRPPNWALTPRGIVLNGAAEPGWTRRHPTNGRKSPMGFKGPLASVLDFRVQAGEPETLDRVTFAIGSSSAYGSACGSGTQRPSPSLSIRLAQ